MKSEGTLAAVVAALVVLAGCAGTVPGSGSGVGSGGDSGTVAFYLSDERNAIGDFEHLNVTVTEVGFGVEDAANNSSEGWEAREVDSVTLDLTDLQGENASRLGDFSVPATEYTKVYVTVSDGEGTLTNGEAVRVKLPSDRLRISTGLTVTSGGVEDFVFDISVFEAGQSGKYILKPVVGESGTDVPIEPVKEGDTGENDRGSKSGEGGDEAAPAVGSASMGFYVSDEQNAIDDFEHLNVTVTEVGLHRVDESGGGSWVTHQVDGRVVDLTRYRGANATRIANFSVANGTYDKVFVYVSDVEGTLTNGEAVRVKLPSEKLHVETRFEADANASIDYVFDISVFEAGQSGKYILKPVISESGTDVPIESTDDDADAGPEGREETEDDETEESEDERAADSLNASFEGNATPGENATLTVTRNGDPAANATVLVEGERTGVTDDAGQYTVSIPENVSELTVRIEADGAEAELELEFESGPGESSDASGGDEAATLRRPVV